MDQKMLRFLESIQLENPEDFDLSFLSIVKSTSDKNFYTYNIVKETPWDYQLIDQFLNALNTINTYKYEINFSYNKKITIEDLTLLIDDFIFNKTYNKIPFSLQIEKEILNLISEKEEDYSSLKPFEEELNSFFNFINYPYEVLINKVEEEEEILELTEEIKETFIKEAKEEQKENEAILLKETQEAYKKMKEERRLSELFSKKGGYEYKKIIEINVNLGGVDFNGKVFEATSRLSRNGKMIYKVGVFDESDAIYVTFIANSKALKVEELDKIKTGSNIRIKGKVDFNKYSRDCVILAHFFDLLPDDELRNDNEEVKRVELHLHTKMSEMDGCASIMDYAKLASHMGHKALAVTDHGVVQAFPEAQAAAKKYGLKMIYGSELYLVEDYLKGALFPSDTKLADATYVVFDLESTGLSAKYDRITEFGAVKIKGGMIVDRLDILINPGMNISKKIEDLTGISNELIKDCPKIEEVMEKIMKFIGTSILVSHNIEFDYGMLNEAYERIYNKELIVPCIDTLALSRYIFPINKAHNLGALCSRLKVDYDAKSAHRADYDASVLSSCWLSLRASLTENNKDLRHCDLEKLEINNALYKHLRGTHVTVLAKNKKGLKDLYKIISASHLDYLGLHPCVPRSLLIKYREDLLVGSACFNGDVFNASSKRNNRVLEEVISFYDYIEIQPLPNYSYLVEKEEISSEVLKKVILDIVATAKRLNKIVVATGDVHYLNPADRIYRDIMVANQAVGGIIHPLFPHRRNGSGYFESPQQEFRSTGEMLELLSWLGKENAYEFVITNSNLIADKIEKIIPISDQLFTPTIENCAEKLKSICFENAHALYGDVLPEYIENRLNVELEGIIGHGFSVTYYIARELIKKAHEDGYIVGSRGSVGSSFAATMAEITEVNPLPPFYRCPKCKKVIFHDMSDGITSGFDLPEKDCPDCGTNMIRDGQNIPFETFLGFSAEKVPDIDLNFPADYQATAHQYTKVLLGEDKVFRAGTISTVQDKTAYGYVRKYFEVIGRDPNKIKGCYTAALAKGCTEIKKTTGQHPGGIVVIPSDMDVYDFTPVQYPAGDIDAAWKTTHFDFHAIHDTILKLDMLGHVDPQALKMMMDLANLKLEDIPMSDQNIFSLFTSDEALKMSHKHTIPDIGIAGIPEFGTNFVKQLVREAKPKSFKELMIISGLSHGTNVWTDNAQELIKNRVVNLDGVIGCRDDIMTYLISKGVDNSLAFKIMELVRKGKLLSPAQEEEMLKHGIPQYYIDSCNKIKYLFPKGHACAYVTMAVRVAYFKIYYPLEFYATFFSLRCDQYDIESLIKGEDAIYQALSEFKDRRNSNNPELALTNKEEEVEKGLILALEMAERGYKFANIDIMRSDSDNFIIDLENKALIPPFKVLDGIGAEASKEIIRARNEKPFDSILDFKTRGKVSSKTVELLRKIHALDGYRENDEITLFDLGLF